MAKKRLRKPGKKDTPAKKRLKLEIREREWNVSWWCKVIIPLLTPTVLLLSVLVSAWWYTNQLSLQREHQRQETITNLKRELASENLRIAAARALADYPKEAIPVLIPSLGDEDAAFTTAVKASLRQIGKDAIKPLVEELRRLQAEVTVVFAPLYQKRLSKIIKGVEAIPESGLTWSVTRDFSMDVLLNKPPEDVKNKLKEAGATDEEMDLVIKKLKDIRSSRPQLKVAHKNIKEALAELLCRNHVERCQLSGLDLSGILLSADLSGAALLYTNLSGAFLVGANLSSASLVGANLSDANLLRANLAGADLAYAKLSGAYLSDADLTGVKGLRDVEDFSNANLEGIKGLSKEDLESMPGLRGR